MNARSPKWFLAAPSPDAAGYLFCLPYSGCGATMYRRWPRALGGVEVVPVQPPGRENRLREDPYETYEELAASLIGALLPYLDRPFAFFGHCGSALPAYEVSVQLAARHLPAPTRVFVSSQVPPHQGPSGRFLEMTDDALGDEVAVLITEMGGRPTPDMISLSLGVLRADIEANKRYVKSPAVRLDSPITAIGWAGDAEVDHRSMSDWSDCGDTTHHVLDGTHYTFIGAPEQLVSVITDDFAGAVPLR
jgi:surfactin synthase thioesterase subunit